MKKTVLGLDEDISIILLSSLVVLFAFISGYQRITNLVSFLFVILKYLVFIMVPLWVYLTEKFNDSLKKIAGIYASYFIISLLCAIVLSTFVGAVVPYFAKLTYDLINLVISFTSLIVLIHGILQYNQIDNKIYTFIIVKSIYKIGDIVSYPILKFINKYINKQHIK